MEQKASIISKIFVYKHLRVSATFVCLFAILCFPTFSQTIKTDTTSIQLKDTTKNLSDTTTEIKDSTYQSKIIHKDSATFSVNDFLFNITDSIIIEKWKYNTEIHNFDFSAYDSTLQEFHIDHPAYINSINNSYLGNSGLAVHSNIFFEPNPQTEYLFLRSFTPYLHQAKQSDYYNVSKPFTLFGYQTGPKEEQNIQVIHTQNVNKFLNGFAKFNNYTGEGFYTQQSTKNNSGALGGALVKNRFATHLSFNFSRIDVSENGGVVDPYFVTDTLLKPAEIRTRLNMGKNFIKDRQLFIDQKIGFVKIRKSDTLKTGGYLFTLQYNYSRQKSFRLYQDQDEIYENIITKQKLTMYENNYSGGNTFDTSSYKSNNHLIRLNFEEIAANPFGFGLYVGIGMNNEKYFYYNKDTLFINKLDIRQRSEFIEAGIFRLNPTSWLNFYGYTRYFTSGRRQNDFSISGMLALKIGKGIFASEIQAKGKTENKTPDYFINNYYSNHYRWKNNFKAQNITELKVLYNLHNLNTSIGVRYALISNYVYFNKQAVPEQFSSNFNVLDIYLDNKISYWNFNLLNKVVYQESDKPELLPLPKLSFYNALYYEKGIHFKSTEGDIKLQLGVDVRFWTKFYAKAYCPATSQFYLQSTLQTGNYPFIGAFLNLEIKRMRIYFKSEHLNYEFMRKHKHRNSFIAPNYPAPPMTIKYGIAWTFYD